MSTLVFPAPALRPRRRWGWLLRWAAGTPTEHTDELAWPPRRAVTVAPGAGEPKLVELYHHRRLALVRLAVLLVDDLPTAEDVVQDAFAAAYRRHGAGLSGVENPDAYLNTAVVNAARSVLRRRRTFRATLPALSALSAQPRVEHAPPTDENLLIAEEHREVLAALRRLPQRQREVLVLRYWSGLSEAQIAESLDISRGTVKSTASRGLAALEKLLETAE